MITGGKKLLLSVSKSNGMGFGWTNDVMNNFQDANRQRYRVGILWYNIKKNWSQFR